MVQTPPEYDFITKIILLGEFEAGKTMIWNRYCKGQFYHDMGIGMEFYGKIVHVDGKRVKLQIWDTCSQERFRALSRPYYRNAHGVLLCYAIDNRESFEKIGYWIDEVKKNANEKDIFFVLMGAKSDLSNERVVGFDEGGKLAETHGMKFFETSAKDNLNVDEPFLALAKDITVILNKKKDETQEATGNKLHRRENSRKIEINCFKCS